ncbi:MAG: hypothetical protein M0026_14540 [Nocardiopsaceae bacterium]|nr:hypothetical protein [Nocardiopsaceae bacterium]
MIGSICSGVLPALADVVLATALAPLEVTWDPSPKVPDFGFGDSQSPEEDPIERLIHFGQGVIVIIGVIGILYSAGKMAVGKLGRSEVAADGVGGAVWTIMGVSLMLVAISVVTTLAGVG